MTYRIARDGQLFGPYTAAEVQAYLADGHIVPTDLAQLEGALHEGAQVWLPVAELFPAAPTGIVPPPAPAGYPASHPGGLPTLFPDPPDLPWWLALLLGLLTLGAFFVIWDLVLSSWLRRVDRSSTAIGYYVAIAVLYVMKLPGEWSTFRYNIGYDIEPAHSHYSWLISLAGIVLFFASRFVFRTELLRHFNGPEPIGLRLGPIMTFFFGGIYFQYHFNRINELKRALRLSVPGV
jgi:hypothetical protein